LKIAKSYLMSTTHCLWNWAKIYAKKSLCAASALSMIIAVIQKRGKEST